MGRNSIHPPFYYDGGPATASNTYATSIAVNSVGDVFVSDGDPSAEGAGVRKISGGIVTLVAGTCSGGYSGR